MAQKDKMPGDHDREPQSDHNLFFLFAHPSSPIFLFSLDWHYSLECFVTMGMFHSCGVKQVAIEDSRCG